MSRIKSLYLGALSVVLVMGISSGGASAQQASCNYDFGCGVATDYDDSFVKVGRKGRRNTAIALGAIALGTILYNQNQRRSYQRNYGNNHVNWCYNRYRSYRAYDNTFQPYRGPRRQCISPYY